MERVDEETAARRAECIMDIQAGIMDAYNQSRIGQTVTVLCEGVSEENGLFYGRSYAESPDIDGYIFFTGKDIEPGRFYSVKLTKDLDGDMYGEKQGGRAL